MTSALLHCTMTTKEAAEYLGVSEATMKRWRSVGEGPKFFRLGKKIVRYRQSELDLYVIRGGSE